MENSIHNIIIAILISSILVVATVLIHFEGLRLLSGKLNDGPGPRKHRKVLFAVLFIFLIHLTEIGLYAFGIWFADIVVDVGRFAGAREDTLMDYFYFSAETFSSLGLGDIYPIGPLRMLVSIETLNGLLLIGWSASFTFLMMQRYWFVSNPKRIQR